jgi:ABC-type transporter Mla subunit MlaD
MTKEMVTRQELYQELTEFRKEVNGQYMAIAEFMGRSQAILDAHATRMDCLDEDLENVNKRVDDANTRDKVWSGINTFIAGVAAVLAGTGRV